MLQRIKRAVCVPFSVFQQARANLTNANVGKICTDKNTETEKETCVHFGMVSLDPNGQVLIDRENWRKVFYWCDQLGLSKALKSFVVVAEEAGVLTRDESLSFESRVFLIDSRKPGQKVRYYFCREQDKLTWQRESGRKILVFQSSLEPTGSR